MNTYSKKLKHTRPGVRKNKYRYGPGRESSSGSAEILRRDSVLAALDIFTGYGLRTKISDTLCWIAQKTENIDDIDYIAETFAFFAGSGMEGKIAELFKRSVIKDRSIAKNISGMLIERKDLAEAPLNIFPMLVYVYSNIENAHIKRNIPLYCLEDIVYACLGTLKNYAKITDSYNESVLQAEFFRVMNKKAVQPENLEEKIEKLDSWALSVSKDLRRYGFLFNRI